MSEPAVTRRRRNEKITTPIPTATRVDESWVEALEEVTSHMDHGEFAIIHRQCCSWPKAQCDCAAVMLGPAVRDKPQ